jgi:hypothetical protein
VDEERHGASRDRGYPRGRFSFLWRLFSACSCHSPGGRPATGDHRDIGSVSAPGKMDAGAACKAQFPPRHPPFPANLADHWWGSGGDTVVSACGVPPTLLLFLTFVRRCRGLCVLVPPFSSSLPSRATLSQTAGPSA